MVALRTQSDHGSEEGQRLKDNSAFVSWIGDYFRHLWKKWQKYIQLALVLFPVLYLVSWLYRNWQGLARYDWEFDYSSLAISVFPFVISVCLGALGWGKVLRALEPDVNWSTTTDIWMFSLLGKYLPAGTAWYVAGRMVLCDRYTIKKRHASVSILLEFVLVAISCSVVFLISLPFWQGDRPVVGIESIVLGVVLLGLFILYPPVLERIINLLTRMVRRGSIRLQLRYRDTLSMLVPYLAFWLSLGTAFYFLCDSVQPTPVSFLRLVVLSGAFAASWLVGFLAVFAPNGLGVREATLTLLLSFHMPMPVAVVVSLLSRAWSAIGELLTFALYFGTRSLIRLLMVEKSVQEEMEKRRH